MDLKTMNNKWIGSTIEAEPCTKLLPLTHSRYGTKLLVKVSDKTMQ
jgi:hypothetical protein